MSQGMLVCLDIEFSASSGKVFEVGVCEFDSGTPLVNARVKHNCSEDELHKPPPLRTVNQYSMLLSLRTQQKIYHKSQPSDTLLDVHSLVTKFRDGSITPDTIILVWATSGRDLELVRDLFYGAGNMDYRNMLPPKDHCAFVIPDFRRNMSILPGSGILHLEVIFNLLFGNHDLADKNHRALPDAFQLRLMMKLFIELCKPPEQRQLSMFPRSIDEYLPTLLQCKEQQERSLTTKQIRKHTKTDDLPRLNIDSWTRPVSSPLKRKQTTLNKSGILISCPSGSMRNMTELGKEQNGKRKATLDLALDQEPRSKRHAVTVDLALIDPETPKALSANLKNHVTQDTRQGLQDAGLQNAVCNGKIL